MYVTSPNVPNFIWNISKIRNGTISKIHCMLKKRDVKFKNTKRDNIYSFLKILRKVKITFLPKNLLSKLCELFSVLVCVFFLHFQAMLALPSRLSFSKLYIYDVFQLHLIKFECFSHIQRI